jgi:hypothetical protein
MASHRVFAVMSGRLSGMGREADCTVNAVKVSLPGTDISHSANCRVHHAERDLPDGQYLVTFDEQTKLVEKRDGFWFSD